jgi:hypothetical protein
MSRLDIAFMGRELGRNPIRVKSARRIEHDAKWRGWKDRAAWIACGLLIAAAVCVMVVCAA